MIKAINNIIKSIKCPLTKEERQLLHKLQSYIVNPIALDDYRHTVKDNSKDDYYICKNKLIRNCILGRSISKHENKESFQYGNLEIFVNHLYKEIYAVKNNKGRYVYEVDKNKKEWLDRELKITYKSERKVG